MYAQGKYSIEASIGYRFPVYQNPEESILYSDHGKTPYALVDLGVSRRISDNVELVFKIMYYERVTKLDCVYWPLPNEMIGSQLGPNSYIVNHDICSHTHMISSSHFAFLLGGRRIFRRKNMYFSIYDFVGIESRASVKNESFPIFPDRNYREFSNSQFIIPPPARNELGASIGRKGGIFDVSFNVGLYTSSFTLEEVAISNYLIVKLDL
ncbi:MAG: hypothetical protein AAF828_09800, partial [Bacteroidota bacterium]